MTTSARLFLIAASLSICALAMAPPALARATAPPPIQTGVGLPSDTCFQGSPAPFCRSPSPSGARESAAVSLERLALAETHDAASPSAPPTECDSIAALRAPYSSSAEVHAVAEPDWQRGAAACAAETRSHPGVVRFIYQFGRTQDHLKNYIEALRAFKAAAAAGDADAMVDLGAMYYNGHGVVQSYPTAFDWFSKAAAAGSNRALANMASMYGDGRGVAKDDAKSLGYAEQAVEAGNPFGLKIIADHYFNGAGVPRDYAMAAQYLQQAADVGDGRSMKFLANMYESGYLGPLNPQKAAELRLRALQVDPGSPDPIPAHLPMFRRPSQMARATVHRRRYVLYRPSYRPSWQAAPGDTRCCPNSMLVCPLGRHFCGH